MKLKRYLEQHKQIFLLRRRIRKVELRLKQELSLPMLEQNEEIINNCIARLTNLRIKLAQAVAYKNELASTPQLTIAARTLAVVCLAVASVLLLHYYPLPFGHASSVKLSAYRQNYSFITVFESRHTIVAAVQKRIMHFKTFKEVKEETGFDMSLIYVPDGFSLRTVSGSYYIVCEENLFDGINLNYSDAEGHKIRVAYLHPTLYTSSTLINAFTIGGDFTIESRNFYGSKLIIAQSCDGAGLNVLAFADGNCLIIISAYADVDELTRIVESLIIHTPVNYKNGGSHEDY